jgi:hypothetical protein
MAEPEIGDAFQQGTKYQRGHLPSGRLDWAEKPAVYKHYPSAPAIALSSPQITDGASLWRVLRRRRSVRRFRDEPMREADLSLLLWAAQGITLARREFGLRTAPSAGALYPVETYLVVHSVEGLQGGVYHYSVEEHALEQLKTGDFRVESSRAALDQ